MRFLIFEKTGLFRLWGIRLQLD